MGRQPGRDPVRDRGVVQVAHAHVDRHPQARDGGTPPGHLGQDLVDDPPGQQPHDRGVLGDADQLLRVDLAVARVAPAQQRLQPHDRAGRDVDLRLVVQRDAGIAGLQRPAQVGEQAHPFGCAVVGAGDVHGHGVGALLGVVPRDVGVA